MKPLKQFVQKSNALDRLRLNAQQLGSLLRKIRAALPLNLREHVVGCAQRPGTVVVFVDSAAWAALLRYQQPDILDVCRQQLGERVMRIQIKVLPPEAITGKPLTPKLSENARRLLRGTADSVPDEELAAALRRLSNPDQDAE